MSSGALIMLRIRYLSLVSRICKHVECKSDGSKRAVVRFGRDTESKKLVSSADTQNTTWLIQREEGKEGSREINVGVNRKGRVQAITTSIQKKFRCQGHRVKSPWIKDLALNLPKANNKRRGMQKISSESD
jgi:hypothetical protein